jgi:hypothetical protein
MAAGVGSALDVGLRYQELSEILSRYTYDNRGPLDGGDYVAHEEHTRRVRPIYDP